MVSILQKTHEFDGSKRGVLYKNSKQVCLCHIKLDPACMEYITVAKNYDYTCDNVEVQGLSLARATVDSSATVDSLDTTRVAMNLNDLVLSDRFEVLAANLDVISDTEELLLVPNQSDDSQGLQRSPCSDDRIIQSENKQNDRNLAVRNIFDGKIVKCQHDKSNRSGFD